MISEKMYFVYYLDLATISFEIVSREEYNMPQNMEIHFLSFSNTACNLIWILSLVLKQCSFSFNFTLGNMIKITFSCIMLVAHLLKPILYRPWNTYVTQNTVFVLKNIRLKPDKLFRGFRRQIFRPSHKIWCWCIALICQPLYNSQYRSKKMLQNPA